MRPLGSLLLAQEHIASKWQSQDLYPGLSTSKFHVLSPIFLLLYGGPAYTLSHAMFISVFIGKE